MPPTFLQTYADEVSRQLDFLPTWPLNYDVKLGDVGVLEGRVFKRTDTLESLGIRGLAVRKGHGSQVLEFSSREGVQTNFAAGAQSAIKTVGGEVEIKFSREGAVFLRVGEHTLQQFESTDTLGKEIIRRYKNGAWKRDRVVVTEVVRSAAATVLVSGSGSSSATFKLDGSVPGVEALAKGKLAGLVSLTGSFVTKIVGEEVSPLLRTSGVRGLFRKDFRTTRGGFVAGVEPADAEPAELAFGRVDSASQLDQ